MSGMQIHIDTVHIDQVVMTGTPPSLRWHVGPIQRQEAPMPLEVSMTSEEKCRLAITPMTPGGDPAPIDGDAVWTVSGTCTLEAIDATSTWVLGRSPGDSVVTVTADAHMSPDEVLTIADTATIHVAAPMAAQLGLAADPPVLQSA